MKIKDFEKSKNELQRTIEKNNESSLLYDERTRMAKVNQVDYKLTTTIAFSLFGYLGLFVISAISLAAFDTPLFIQSIPREIYPFVLLGGSGLIGTITRKAMEKKFKLKERLANFTNANTEQDKLTEEIKNEIELKKIETRNIALTRTIENLTSNEKTLSSLSSKYEINDKDNNLSIKEREEKGRQLESTLQSKYKELDTLTTTKVIHSRFSHQLDKSIRIMETLAASCMGGLYTLLYIFITIMIAYINTPFQLPPNFNSFLAVISPFIAGTVGTAGYLTYRDKVKNQAFETIKENLPETILNQSAENHLNCSQDLEQLINNTITVIIGLTIELQENKRALEEFYITCSEEETIMLSSTKSISEAKQSVLTTEDALENSSLEEPSYESITPKAEKQNEAKTLTKRRKNPYQ